MTPAPVVPAVRALTCPNCGGTIALRAAGSTVSLICEHCGSTLDATDPALAVITAASQALARPRIALGTRGLLDGATWDAIGYMERRSEDGGWSEYLLFNPYCGYRFLIDDGEGFSFATLLDRAPEDATLDGVILNGTRYTRIEASYPASVTFVLGEFYWRVAVGERVEVTDYERGTAGLSCEESDGERSWSLSRRLRPGEAETAFAIAPASGPERSAYTPGLAAFGDGIPGRSDSSWGATWKIALAAIVALLLISLAKGPATLVATRDITIPLDEHPENAVIGPIDLPDRSTALSVRASAPGLDNAWVDLDYSLVDRKTQASYDAYGVAEHYSGSDSDGPWSEGDSAPDTSFAAIGGGQYDLVVDLAGHHWGSSLGFEFDAGAVPLHITVYRRAGFAANFFLAAFLILLWPVAIWWFRRRAAQAEQRRWSR